VLVCNEGYSSSLAASTLQRLGLANATDLCGGYQAWRALLTEDPVQEGQSGRHAQRRSDGRGGQ
jgi:hypothetical protein